MLSPITESGIFFIYKYKTMNATLTQEAPASNTDDTTVCHQIDLSGILDVPSTYTYVKNRVDQETLTKMYYELTDTQRDNTIT